MQTKALQNYHALCSEREQVRTPSETALSLSTRLALCLSASLPAALVRPGPWPLGPPGARRLRCSVLLHRTVHWDSGVHETLLTLGLHHPHVRDFTAFPPRKLPLVGGAHLLSDPTCWSCSTGHTHTHTHTHTQMHATDTQFSNPQGIATDTQRLPCSLHLISETKSQLVIP